MSAQAPQTTARTPKSPGTKNTRQRPTGHRYFTTTSLVNIPAFPAQARITSPSSTGTGAV